MQRNRFHIQDLATEFGISRQTIHHYVNQGILPPPEGRTKAAAYTTVHWQRLRMIQQAREQKLTLADLKERFSR